MFQFFLGIQNLMPKWIRSRFSVENFSFHSAKNFRIGTLQCFANFGFRKILCLSDVFFVSQYGKTFHGNLAVLCFRKLLVTKKLMDRSGVS